MRRKFTVLAVVAALTTFVLGYFVDYNFDKKSINRSPAAAASSSVSIDTSTAWNQGITNNVALNGNSIEMDNKSEVVGRPLSNDEFTLTSDFMSQENLDKLRDGDYSTSANFPGDSAYHWIRLSLDNQKRYRIMVWGEADGMGNTLFHLAKNETYSASLPQVALYASSNCDGESGCHQTGTTYESLDALYLIAGAWDYPARVNEIRILEMPAEDEIATNVSMVTANPDTDKANVIDGDPATYFMMNDTGVVGRYWKIDLGESKLINARLFYAANYGIMTAGVTYSTDDINYQNWGYGTGSSETYLGSFPISIVTSPNILARYLKVVQGSPYPHTYNELKVYNAFDNSATHTSAATQLDAGDHQTVNWTSLASNATLPANTAVNYRFRTSDDSTNWSAWSSSVPYSASIDLSSLTSQRYLQIESTLSNTDGTSTPILNSFTAYYDYTDATPPTCSDGVKNGDETGVDCGGSCSACPIPETCSDSIKNQDETGVDCGGSCEACPVEPTCSDEIKNGDETGVDCGGSCSACPVDPTCSDGIQNQDETGVDTGGVCGTAPTCSDGIQNGDETGVDCGGSCPTCSQPEVCQLSQCLAQAQDNYTECQTGTGNSNQPSACSSNLCAATRQCFSACDMHAVISKKTTISQPNGGEIYNIADTANIKWRYDSSYNNLNGLIENSPVLLSISKDGGQSYKTIKLLISADQPNSAESLQARELYKDFEIGSYQRLGNLSFSYPWISQDLNFVSKTVKLKLEPLTFNCMINFQPDESDNNFELAVEPKQMFLRIQPSSAKVNSGAEATFIARTFLANGQEVTASSKFLFTASRNASIKSVNGNTVILVADIQSGYYERALLASATYQGLAANSYAALEITTDTPGGKDCGIVCDVFGIVKSFIETFTAENTRRNALGLISLTVGIINLLMNSILLSKSLFAPFVKGKDKRHARSMVYNSLTGQPIAKARVMLINKDLGNMTGMALSDREGHYALDLHPGKDYQIKVEKDGYILFDSTKTNIEKVGLPYSNNYFGEEFTADQDQLVFSKNIPMMEVNPEIETKRILRAAKVNAILIGINIPLVFFGSGISLFILYQYPILFNYLIVSLYVLSFALYLIKNWAIEGKGCGVVINSSADGAAVDLALVRAIRSQNGQLAHTVLSDHEGRYSLSLPRGIYEIFTVKTGLTQSKEVTAFVRSPFKPREDTIEMEELKQPKLPEPVAENQSHDQVLGKLEVQLEEVPTTAPRETNSVSDLIDQYREKENGRPGS